MNRRALLKAGAGIALGSLSYSGERVLAGQEATPPVGETPFPGLLTQNVVELPTAEVGQVALVAMSGVLGSNANFIIHNNTDAAIDYKEVQGMARDADGALVGVIDTDLGAPRTIQPGQYCIGYVEFDKELAADVSIEIEPMFEPVGSGFMDYIDLDVAEVSISGDRIIGVVENHTQSDASSLSHIVGIFFDQAGEIVGVTRTYVDGSSVPAGGYATFSTRVDGGVATDSYAFASSGWAR